MNNTVFLQARMDSSRLPNKVLLPINGIPMIELQISRIKKANKVNNLVVVIPDTDSNDVLNEHLRSLSVNVFRGSANDVLKRFLEASIKFSSDSIIRITADCPLVMPELIDDMIDQFSEQKLDYLSNALEETFPDGLDIEIFNSNILRRISALKLTPEEREHVTLGIYSRPEIFKLGNFSSSVNLSKFRWTVDYLEDLEFVQRIFSYFQGREVDIGISDVLRIIEENPLLDNKIPASFRNISLGRNRPT